MLLSIAKTNPCQVCGDSGKLFQLKCGLVFLLCDMHRLEFMNKLIFQKGGQLRACAVETLSAYPSCLRDDRVLTDVKDRCSVLNETTQVIYADAQVILAKMKLVIVKEAKE